MLQVQDLHKSYGTAVILDGVNFILNDGEHVGLIGPNGSGKTTLLRCITGREQPDRGVIMIAPRGATIGYLAQAFEQLGSLTFGEVVASARSELVEAERAMQEAADALTHADDINAAMQAYEDASTRFESLGGYEREHRVAAVLQGLQLADISHETLAAHLSGGQKTRLGLAMLLLQEPDILLLDEPTNHLDVDALEWLEGFVQDYPNAVLVVSHDRQFLNRTVSRVLYLDPESHAIKSYEGNYNAFEEAREREYEQHVEAWRRQQEYVAKTRADIARVKGRAQAIEASTMGGHRAKPKSSEEQQGLDHVRKLARKTARLAKSREKKLERFMESDDRVEKPKAAWWLKLDFGPAPAGGRSVLHVEDLSFAYPGSPPLLEQVSFDVQYGDRVALVGPNGMGKTTLLRLIEGKLQPTNGTVKIGASVRLGVLSQEQETLNPDATVLDTVLRERAMSTTEARTFLHFFLFSGDDVFRHTGECSLGERSRLQLALLVLRGCNLLLLDEPLNHLDIDGRAHFEAALEAFEGTVIAVAHDRAFLHSYPDRVLEVKAGKVRVFEGGYEDYLGAAARR